MTSTTTVLSDTWHILIPPEIRQTLHWNAGLELTMTTTENGVVLEAKSKPRGKRLENLIGFLQHEGPPIPIEELCKPVD